MLPAEDTPDHIEIAATVSRDAEISVRRSKNGPAIMGTFDRLENRVVFHPSLPLPVGQQYRFEWQEPGGGSQHVEFSLPAPVSERPFVAMRPSGVAFPANALRFYLHFSEPMEQGVFLERLHLQDGSGAEIAGPFRETELWSPDGKRLTIWFHPGRQKQGVNLQEDEGPVLAPNQNYQLVIDGSWRSTSGFALGDDVRMTFTTSKSDHEPPSASSIQIIPPLTPSLAPLIVKFSDPLDTAMLHSAIRVATSGSRLTGQTTVNNQGTEWRFVPDQEWTASPHELEIEPQLEDLAGNSFLGPFEVDLQKGRQPVIAPPHLPFTPRKFTP